MTTIEAPVAAGAELIPSAPTPTQVADAVRAGFEAGITLPLDWRRAQLQALDSLLADNSAEIEAALHEDLGRHPLETYVAEIFSVRTEIGHLVKNLARWTKPRRAGVPLMLQPASAKIVRQPLGTVLVIAPWNYPIHLLLMPVAGAIAAGNAVVMKPSHRTPATAALLARLVPRYLDQRAVQLVEGPSSLTTELLASRWDHIFYTGSPGIGRVVMEAASRHLTPVTLELGGKSPVWVDASADIEDAASWLSWGKFLNAGQTCVAPDYVLTTPDVTPRLVDALARQIEARYGRDPHESADFGRMVNRAAVDRVAGLLTAGRVAVGGQVDRDERYVAPTVLTGVRLDDPVMQEEIFGPVLPIVEVRDADEAIAVINGRDKPLALYVFTRTPAVRRAFETGTSSGSMVVNAVIVQLGAPELPFGGVGLSGFGAYHGEHSIVTFSHERPVLRRHRGPNLVAFAQPPFTARKERLARR